MKKKIITIKNAKFYKPKSKPSKEGIKVEMEHTPQRKVAEVITGNHDDEFGKTKKGKSRYYKALKPMEQKLKQGKK